MDQFFFLSMKRGNDLKCDDGIIFKTRRLLIFEKSAGEIRNRAKD